jgi:hypothetical protein
MYEEDYPKKNINIGDARAEAKKTLTELRSSNILMGNTRPNYQTSHVQTYVSG